VAGRRKTGMMPIEITGEVVEGEMLPACGAPGCRVVGRPGEVLCDQHHAEQRLLAARRRLAQAAPMAADVLADLVENGSTDDIKRRAAADVLDRTGLRPGVEVNITAAGEAGPSPSEVLRERLARLRERAVEVAETASDTETS
jgi:hypothetical protein